jgi:hypothetical protein
MPLKKIPDNLTIYSRPPVNQEDLFGNIVTVRDSYAVDSTNEKRKESAERWMNNIPQVLWDHVTRDYIQNNVEDTKITNVPNQGFKLRILDLEVRSQGGRAYKVVDQNSNQFDLREDTLLDVIKNVGILPGGELPGTYIFSLQGSEMKLIREGSEQHKELLDASTVKARTPTKILEPGKVYYNSKGTETYIFLGVVNGEQMWVKCQFFESKSQYLFYSPEYKKSKTVYGQGEWPYGSTCYSDTLDILIDGYKKDMEDAIKREKRYKVNPGYYSESYRGFVNTITELRNSQ